MEATAAIQITLTMLSAGGAISAASWARSAMMEAQQLRTEVLDAISGLRNEVAVRRVIRSLDEVPPELMSPTAKELIEETIKASGLNPVKAMQAAIEIGVLYSEINRERNKAIGFNEDDLTSGVDEDEPSPSEPEMK